MLELCGVGMLLSILAPFLLLSADVPPPPVRIEPAPDQSQRFLVEWNLVSLRCVGMSGLDTAGLKQPFPTVARRIRADMLPVRVAFSIDENGRPHSISHAEYQSQVIVNPDIVPALAASRFPADRSAAECEVIYRPVALGFDDASLEQLVKLRGASRKARVPTDAWDRIGERDCDIAPPPRPRIRAYADFGQVDRIPGEPSWGSVAFDIDDRGNVQNARLVASSGNETLNAASLAPVEESKYSGRAATGCVRSFRINAGVIESPTRENLPNEGEDERCNAADRWADEPKLRYPENFRNRGIEGWAIIRFDVAPWGQLGNLEVLASQPADDFGGQAMLTMRTAKFAAQGQGIVGCTEVIRYSMKVKQGSREEK